jgi:putative transcriptional regulator
MNTSHGNKIAFLRKRDGINQADLAMKIGIDRACLSLIENDKRKVSLDECILLCKAFHITVDEFLGNNQSPWINTNSGERPADDKTVFVINTRVEMLPIKAYYQETNDMFFSLESCSINMPILITHYMYIPE